MGCSWKFEKIEESVLKMRKNILGIRGDLRMTQQSKDPALLSILEQNNRKRTLSLQSSIDIVSPNMLPKSNIHSCD